MAKQRDRKSSFQKGKSPAGDSVSKETIVGENLLHEGAVKVHLVYPNSYHVGMSSLGYQAVYSAFAEQPEVSIERAFMPARKAKNKEWLTYETSRGIAECDALAFSLSFESDYLNALSCLKAGGLLFPNAEAREAWIADKSYRLPLLIAGGTAVTLNPEPISDFFDIVFLGEAEEFIPEFSRVLLAGKGSKSRQELLREFSRIEGVYIPSQYMPRYGANGTIARVERLYGEGEKNKPSRRVVTDLSKFPCFSRILTPDTEFSNMFLVEVSRACETGCRFCAAGHIYRPVRRRSFDSLQEVIRIGENYSGLVGIVGAAVSSHPDIIRLCEGIAESGGRASLSSIMAHKVTPKLAESLVKNKYETVALAPETGSERLRYRIGKPVSNEKILGAVRMLGEAGISRLKLYFMVGLPSETENDVRAIVEFTVTICDLMKEVGRQHKNFRARIILSVNPFVPKASTPFQWEPMGGKKELQGKLTFLKKELAGKREIEFGAESVRESEFQALLSRGDRRLSSILYQAASEGEDWKWVISKTEEVRVGETNAVDYYVRRKIPFEEILPWDHLDMKLSRDMLIRENLASK